MNSASASSDSRPTDEPAATDAPQLATTATDAPGIDPTPADPIDLDAIRRDLDGVESALARLDDGTYWSDELTGAPLPDGLLATDPTARRAGD